MKKKNLKEGWVVFASLKSTRIIRSIITGAVPLEVRVWSQQNTQHAAAALQDDDEEELCCCDVSRYFPYRHAARIITSHAHFCGGHERTSHGQLARRTKNGYHDQIGRQRSYHAT